MGKAKFGEILVTQGVIDSAQVESALSLQRRTGRRFGNCLVSLGYITEERMIASLAEALKLPTIDVTRIPSAQITQDLLRAVPLKIAHEHRIVPLSIRPIGNRKRLIVATPDPTQYAAFDKIQFSSGLPLLIMLSSETGVSWFLRNYYLGESSLPAVHKNPQSIESFGACFNLTSKFYSEEDFTREITGSGKTKKWPKD